MLSASQSAHRRAEGDPDGSVAQLDADQQQSVPVGVDKAVAVAPDADPPHPSAVLLARIECIVGHMIADCAAYKQRWMAEQAADGAEAEQKRSSSSSQQYSQQSQQEWDSGSEYANDGGDEKSDSHGSERRKRKRKPAAPTRRSCLTIHYDDAADMFNQHTQRYEQRASEDSSTEQPCQRSAASMEQLSQQVQDGLRRQQEAVAPSSQHTLRFPFPLSGAAHCSQSNAMQLRNALSCLLQR